MTLATKRFNAAFQLVASLFTRFRFSHEQKQIKEAESRWLAINQEAKVCGCECGKPASRVQYDSRVVGNVMRETWTCDEHVGSSAWTFRPDGQPQAHYQQSSQCADCDDMCPQGGPIGRPITTWHCLNREPPMEN